MKKIALLFLVLFASISLMSQNVTCTDLKEFTKENGYYKSSISSYTLDSEWLYKVTAYTYKYKTYVIAEIKTNEYSYTTTEYVFCNVPNQNWSNFNYGSYNDTNSYGKRFHKYIMRYKCNCY